jgi:hypothetical protein
VLGPVLDELAFDTRVDLDEVRQLMLRLWNVHHATDAPTAVGAEAAGEVDAEAAGEVGAEIAAEEADAGTEPLGERLARTLDEGLRAKRDVEDLFAQLERMAGLEPGASDDDEDGDDAADALGGDLGPLVEEYLWETGRDGDPAVQPLRTWLELQTNAAVPHTDLEQVTGLDLMRLLLHCYLGAAPAERAAAVRTAFEELQRFYEWVQQTQDLDLTSVFAECRGSLVDQIDRLQAAGIALSTRHDPSTRPSVLRIEDVAEGGFGVQDDEGGHHWLASERAATASLRVGDILLGAVVKGERGPVLAGLVVVLPADARTLIE